MHHHHHHHHHTQHVDTVAVAVAAAAVVAGVVHNPDAGAAADNNLHFPSLSRHVEPAAVVVFAAAAAVAMSVVVEAAACRSSTARHTFAMMAHSRMGVEPARTQAYGAEPAVSLPVGRRTVVTAGLRVGSAKKQARYMHWGFLSDVVQVVRPHHHLVVAVVGAGLGVVGIALVQAVVVALVVVPVLVGFALLGPVAVDDTHPPSSP